MWDIEGNPNRNWITVGSYSSRLSCPMGEGKDKSFQWNIEIKLTGSKSLKR